MEQVYDPKLVILSVLVATFASYTALNLAHSVTLAKGRARIAWLTGGSLAMGFGIWSMHFVGMLAFSMPGMTMAYDVPLLFLSIVIAIAASALALVTMSRNQPGSNSTKVAALAMGAAIAGMHYTGMASMRMAAVIQWNLWLVALSIVIAIVASYGALWIAFHYQKDTSLHGFRGRIWGAVVMGIAIAGMHYTGMLAANFHHTVDLGFNTSNLIVSSSLTVAVMGATLLILGLALAGSIVDRAFARRTAQALKVTDLYQQAQKALGALREERELRELFISSFTHDLRTPLTAARLNAQLLVKSMASPEKIHSFSAKVVENLERTERMIRDLLDAHRMSAEQKLPIHPEECDLVVLTKETLENLATVYGDRFKFKHERSSTIGQWDSEYLRRMIENLCHNAIKYGNPHTPVTVTVTSVTSFIEICVHNYGKPIEPAEQKNLFVLFHRSQEAQESRTKGWGIGLSLVKGVAESHGGSVSVESHAESGTTFIIKLPKSSSGSFQRPTKHTSLGMDETLT